MSLHLVNTTFILYRDEEVDKFIHDITVWFNAAVSTNPPWIESRHGSGYVGEDHVDRFERSPFGTVWAFWGRRKQPSNRKNRVPPFCLKVAVARCLGQAAISVTVGNGFRVPFAISAHKLIEEWVSRYQYVDHWDVRALMFERARFECTLHPLSPSGERWHGDCVFSNILTQRVLEETDYRVLEYVAMTAQRQRLPVGMVLHDELVKVVPAELRNNTYRGRLSYMSCCDVPLTGVYGYCEQKTLDDFMSGVSKRLSITYLMSGAEEITKTYNLQFGRDRMSVKGKRKCFALMRDRTRFCIQNAKMTSYLENGMFNGGVEDFDRTSDEFAHAYHVTTPASELDAEQVAKKESSSSCQLSREHVAVELKPYEEPADLRKPKFDRLAFALAEGAWPCLSLTARISKDVDVDASCFYDVLDARLAVLEQKERHLFLLEKNEVLERENEALEARISALETELYARSQAYQEQKRLNDSLADALAQKGEVMADEPALDAVATWIVQPERQMSVPNALRVAEILSQGRLVVLPSAKKSAEDVPVECQSGSRCFQLLMRLTKLWMPAYLNGGDAAARKVFTPNTYSSRESNILQGTKELIRCRTFNYKGQEMPMLKHLCIGVKRNTALTLRIYFECVQDEEKIVVGWCGEHLPIL